MNGPDEPPDDWPDWLYRVARQLECIVFNAVIPNLQAVDKEDAIEQIVERLAVSGAIREEHREEITLAILRREVLGSSAIGRGIAVPHTKHESAKRLVGTLAYSPAGLEFNSLDGRRTHLICLMISPPDVPGEHLEALEQLSRLLRLLSDFPDW